MKHLHLYNTLTREKKVFEPLDRNNVRMYVCGPTVYDRPHIGNARAVVVYDVLYRLLKHLYPKVTYVRNITDVDDKINAAAKANGEPISALTKRVTEGFHKDMEALNCLPPDVEPRATGHIKEMIELIQKIIKNGHGYVSEGHVLFDVNSMSSFTVHRSSSTEYTEDGRRKTEDYFYGKLSGKKLDELIAGARVEVESYKKNPGDFVLWKPAEEGDDPSSVFDCGEELKKLGVKSGRPGWHIECSAMSAKHLGVDFDIHGGGADLKFPHHENEIAQSLCGNKGSHFANYWVHNGFLTVDGEKMSKSLGNFITVRELLDKGVKGEVIRYALLKTNYSEPLNWTEKLVDDATKELDYFYKAIQDKNLDTYIKIDNSEIENAINLLREEFFSALMDNVNLSVCFSILLKFAKSALTFNKSLPNVSLIYAHFLKEHANLLGFLESDSEAWFKSSNSELADSIENKIIARYEAKKAKNWAEADKIRKELLEQGIILEDKPDGTTTWRKA